MSRPGGHQIGLHHTVRFPDLLLIPEKKKIRLALHEHGKITFGVGYPVSVAGPEINFRFNDIYQ